MEGGRDGRGSGSADSATGGCGVGRLQGTGCLSCRGACLSGPVRGRRSAGGNRLGPRREVEFEEVLLGDGRVVDVVDCLEIEFPFAELDPFDGFLQLVLRRRRARRLAPPARGGRSWSWRAEPATPRPRVRSRTLPAAETGNGSAPSRPGVGNGFVCEAGILRSCSRLRRRTSASPQTAPLRRGRVRSRPALITAGRRDTRNGWSRRDTPSRTRPR